MSRKTVSIKYLVEITNDLCKNSAPEQVTMRRGAAVLLEKVLHDTGNYKGFRYLKLGECSGLPGVNYNGSIVEPDIELRFKNTDSTRVEYFA